MKVQPPGKRLAMLLFGVVLIGSAPYSLAADPDAANVTPANAAIVTPAAPETVPGLGGNGQWGAFTVGSKCLRAPEFQCKPLRPLGPDERTVDSKPQFSL
jgi:hypothetical protein